MFTFLYIGIKGRISRKVYWLAGMLPLMLMGFVLGLLLAFLHVPYESGVLIGGLLAWPGLAMQIKRWHDVGKSGWWLLLSFVPYLGMLVWIVIGLVPGMRSDNNFGPNPYAPRDQSNDSVAA